MLSGPVKKLSISIHVEPEQSLAWILAACISKLYMSTLALTIFFILKYHYTQSIVHFVYFHEFLKNIKMGNTHTHSEWEGYKTT